MIKDTSSTSTLSLTGANTYSGATTISSGTLNVTGSLANTSGVTIGTLGTLTGSGNNSTTGIIGGAVSNSAGGGAINLAAGSGTFLTVNGLTLGSTGSYEQGNLSPLRPTRAGSTSETARMSALPAVRRAC